MLYVLTVLNGAFLLLVLVLSFLAMGLVYGPWMLADLLGIL
jgi:hypothetical protein